MKKSAVLSLLVVATFWPVAARAQERRVTADLAAGYVAVVDEPIGFLAIGGGCRRQLGARVSVGPEFVLMFRGGSCSASVGAEKRTSCADAADRAAVLAAKLTYDLFASSARDGAVALYALAGVGTVWQRRRAGDVRTWSSGFDLNVGGGVRARVTRGLSLGGESPTNRLPCSALAIWT